MLMSTWRGIDSPGGPCSKGVIEIEEAEDRATLKHAGGALVSINRFDGSIAITLAVPDAGWEWIKQCVHASMGRSRAPCSLEDSGVSTGKSFASDSASDSEGDSFSIRI